jgi:hypothetical protein
MKVGGVEFEDEHTEISRDDMRRAGWILSQG